MRGFLRWGREEGGVAKSILRVIIAGGAAVFLMGRRALSEETEQHRDFDSTKGYPGEDGAN